MRVAVAGTGRLGVAILAPILESDRHTPVALILNGRATHGFKRSIHEWQGRLMPQSESPLPIAMANGIPRFWLDTQSEAELAALRSFEIDLLITCGFSIILKRPLLDLPKIGCINVHSSLLPKHRGPCPFNHVILAGEKESGVTFHVTDAKIDTGDIVDQVAFPVEEMDTAFAIYNKACATARDRVLPVLDQIEENGIVGRPQSKADATYDKKITRAQLRLDWNRPAAELHRLYRSCMPYEHTYFNHGDREVRVLRAGFDPNPVGANPGTVVRTRFGVRVATPDGAFIVIAGLAGRRVPRLWPMPWNRPREGDVLI